LFEVIHIFHRVIHRENCAKSLASYGFTGNQQGFRQICPFFGKSQFGLQNTVCKLYLRGENAFFLGGYGKDTVQPEKTCFVHLPTKGTSISRQQFLQITDGAALDFVGFVKVERQQVINVTEIYHGRIVSTTKEAMVVELTGTQDKLDAFLTLLSDYEILELARTGLTGLSRGIDDVIDL